jgi:hypothetical protein
VKQPGAGPWSGFFSASGKDHLSDHVLHLPVHRQGSGTRSPTKELVRLRLFVGIVVIGGSGEWGAPREATPLTPGVWVSRFVI